MPSQEDWILRAARLFPSPTHDHIRTSDIPLVLICLDIDDEDLSIRRALGVGRVREIPVSNLVRVLSPILAAENSASERYMMFKTFDKYESGTVSLIDLQRVAVGAGLLTAKECSRIMQTLSNCSNGMTFDHWCYILKDETDESASIAAGGGTAGSAFGRAGGDGSHQNSLSNSLALGRSVSGGPDISGVSKPDSPSNSRVVAAGTTGGGGGGGSNSPKSPTTRSRGSSRIGGDRDRQPLSASRKGSLPPSPYSSPPSRGRAESFIISQPSTSLSRMPAVGGFQLERETLPTGMH